MRDKHILERKVVGNTLYEVRFNGGGLDCSKCCFRNGEGCIRPKDFEPCTCVNRKDGLNVYFTRLRHVGKSVNMHWHIVLDYLTDGRVLVTLPTGFQKLTQSKAHATLYIIEWLDREQSQKIADAIGNDADVIDFDFLPYVASKEVREARLRWTRQQADNKEEKEDNNAEDADTE